MGWEEKDVCQGQEGRGGEGRGGCYAGVTLSSPSSSSFVEPIRQYKTTLFDSLPRRREKERLVGVPNHEGGGGGDCSLSGEEAGWKEGSNGRIL